MNMSYLVALRPAERGAAGLGVVLRCCAVLAVIGAAALASLALG